MTQNFSTKFTQFGAVMPKAGITKFMAKKGDTRIRILSTSEQDFLFAKTHYLKGVGTFHCFGGSCCSICANAPEGESNTQERAILPIAVATPSVTGGIALEFCYLALSETKYSQLVALNSNVGDVTQYDILIQCEEEKYQKYTFLPLVNQPSVVLGSQEQINSANNFLATYRATITNQLGKTLNEQTFQAARAKSLQNAAQSVGVQFVPNGQASQTFVQAQPQVALPQINPTPQQVVATPIVETQPTIAQVTVQPTVVETPATNKESVVVQPAVVETPIQETTPVVESNSTETNIDWSDFMN